MASELVEKMFGPRPPTAERGVGREVLDADQHHAQRQPSDAVRVEAVEVAKVAVVEASKVGLQRVALLSQDGEEAGYSPASPKP